LTQRFPLRLEDCVPRIIFYPNVGQSFIDVINAAESSIVGTAYCLDHEEGCAALRRKAEQGVEVRLLIDYGKWRSPSSRMQPERINSLLRAGAAIKTLNVTERGRYAILHAKSFTVDGLVYMGGSANFTNNACVSEENLLILTDSQIFMDYLSWFERVWRGPSAAEVTSGTSDT